MRTRLPLGFGIWLFASGCGGTAGTDLNQIVNQNPFPDAGADAAASTGSVSAGEAGASLDPFAGAPPYAAQTGPSSHNPGKACIQSGCHGSATAAPSFLFGGTVYTDYQGHTPAVGIEVRAMDARGHAVSAFTGPEGNFYVGTGSQGGVTFPLVVGARNATTTRPMITQVASAFGSCGQSTCHVPGGGFSGNPGDYYPIHVP